MILALFLVGGAIGLIVWVADTPGTEEREAMAAEMRAAAPDLIIRHHYRRGSLLDDAMLTLILSGDPTDEQVRTLACDVLVPILRAHGDMDLYVDLQLHDLSGEWRGEVREICAA